MASFTEYLLDKYASAFKQATEHPFLEQAGTGTLAKDKLEGWCRQDYLYAFVGYIKFASLLLSRLPIADSPPSAQSSRRSKALASAIPLLTFSLSNVSRETDFFISTAEAHGLTIHPSGDPALKGVNDPEGLLGVYEPITRAYVDFLVGTAAGGSVEEGLVLLWAMEKAYFEAWNHAKRIHQSRAPSDNKDQTQKALELFIDNWTCEEFAGFVKDCTDTVDGLDIEPESEMGKRCEAIWKRTLWLEQRFWPSVE